MARCIENNTIEIIPYECPPPKNITCANGKDPVLAYDEYGCCQRYVCDCKCLQLHIWYIVCLFTYAVYFKSESFPFTFQVFVKDGVILITLHSMDSTTLIKGTVHMS